MTTKTPTPVPAPAPAPAPRPTATSPTGVPPTSVNPNYVPPAPVPRNQVDRSPGAVSPTTDPGLETGNVITITVPSISIPSEITPAANVANVAVTATKPGGENLSIQFNSSGTFGGSANLTFDGRSVYVGYKIPLLTTVQSSMAGGTINATGELRAGNIQLTPSNRNGYARLRAQNAASGSGAATANVYGFRTKNDQFVSLTNENGGLATTALILGGTPPYDAEATGNSTAFGISSTLYGTASRGIPSTGGTGENWRTLLNLTGRGELTIGGNITMSPPAFRPWAPSNANVGIRFADGTFQSTAAIITSITVKDEGTSVVANANTINFVGPGVAASDVGGVATITIPGGISGVIIQEEGSSVLTANTINFVGSGVTASNVGGVATVTITGGADTVYNRGNVSGTTIINISDGTIQTCTMTGDAYFDLSSVTSGKSITLVLTQGSGGNKLATYSSTVLWAAGYKTLSTAAGAVDMVNLVNIGGTFYGTLTIGYTA